MSYFWPQLYVPVRRYHDTFDNFFMDRFHDSMDDEFAHRLMNWERQLENTSRDFFELTPQSDSNLQIDASQAVNTGPAGKPEFAVQFNVKDFNPEEVKVSTKDGMLEVSACHEEKSDNSVSRREFKRAMTLPKDIKVGLMKSVLSKDGVLSITAPMQQAITHSDDGDQQKAAVQSSVSGQMATKDDNSKGAMNYSMSVAGYTPQEVSVYVEGNKVHVHAKHDEVARGRKSHKEMTKVFDLPSYVDAHRVRSVINNDTLYIEARLKDDMAGDTHIVPVEHKGDPKAKDKIEQKAKDKAEQKAKDKA